MIGASGRVPKTGDPVGVTCGRGVLDLAIFPGDLRHVVPTPASTGCRVVYGRTVFGAAGGTEGMLFKGNVFFGAFPVWLRPPWMRPWSEAISNRYTRMTVAFLFSIFRE